MSAEGYSTSEYVAECERRRNTAARLLGSVIQRLYRVLGQLNALMVYPDRIEFEWGHEQVVTFRVQIVGEDNLTVNEVHGGTLSRSDKSMLIASLLKETK